MLSYERLHVQSAARRSQPFVAAAQRRIKSHLRSDVCSSIVNALQTVYPCDTVEERPQQWANLYCEKDLCSLAKAALLSEHSSDAVCGPNVT